MQAGHTGQCGNGQWFFQVLEDMVCKLLYGSFMPAGSGRFFSLLSFKCGCVLQHQVVDAGLMEDLPVPVCRGMPDLVNEAACFQA